MAMYVRACSDGPVNQYHDLYLYCHMLSLTHLPNTIGECLNNLALLYVWRGILYLLMVGVGLHKIHSQPGTPCRFNPPLNVSECAHVDILRVLS